MSIFYVCLCFFSPLCVVLLYFLEFLSSASRQMRLIRLLCLENESRFKTFWQTSVSLEMLFSSYVVSWMRKNTHSTSTRFSFRNFIVIGTRSSWNAHDKLASKAIIIKSTCDMQKVIFHMHIYCDAPASLRFSRRAGIVCESP